MRLVGDVAGLAQRLDEVARRLAIVFDDQDAHGDSDSRLPRVRQFGPLKRSGGPLARPAC